MPSRFRVDAPFKPAGDQPEAIDQLVEGVNAGLEKRDWNISRHKMNPELVIRDSTRAAVLSGSDD